MLVVSSLTKHYPSGAGPVPVFDGVSFEMDCGDAAAITGPSGCGKSTLLHILGVLDSPTAGTVSLDTQNPFTLAEAQQARFRNDKIGFVFQDHCLLPQCNVLENVLAPTLIAPTDKGVEERARFLIERVGLTSRISHKPGELSGGEKQRVAIARALINDPKIIMGDEPTGNLDSKNTQIVFDIFKQLSVEFGQTIIAVTHDNDFAKASDRTIIMQDGSIFSHGNES